MTQKIQQFWDKQAKRYDKSEEQYASAYKEIINKTVKYLKPTDRVLDFGCATGTKTIQLAKHVGHIQGLDISKEMIREANNKKEETNLMNISFSQGNLLESEFGTVPFDAIISYGVLHLL